MKRISTAAYQALRAALPVITWYKRPYESFLRTFLREHPELLVGLSFSDTKREIADQLVSKLAADEDVFQGVTIGLMFDVGAMQRFPDIESLQEPEKSQRLAEARKAVEDVRRRTQEFAEVRTEQERLERQRTAHAAKARAIRTFAQDLEALRARFIALQAASSPQQRGRDFETLLNDLFNLFDLEAKIAYNTTNEQIDGALTFDTDDYLVEAKWWQEAVDRAALDVLASKVRRKGKNAWGLFISVSGFTSSALDAYREGTPFLAIDGQDLYCVLDHRIRLDDLLKAKRRHANETGSCYIAVTSLL